MKTPEEILEPIWSEYKINGMSFKGIAIQAMKEYESQSKWIDVYDRLPDNREVVMVFEYNKTDTNRFKSGFYDYKTKSWWVFYDDNESLGYYPSEYVSYWMSLPKSPKDNSGTAESA